VARGTAALSSDPSLFAGVDLVRLERSLAGRRDEYASAQPFPHVVLDDFLEPGRLAQAAAEFGDVDSPDWIGYVHFNEKKFCNPNIDTWGPTLRSVAQTLNSPEFVQMISELTGIDGLIADEGMEGGGLHQSLRGGYLNVHADYTVHPLHATWRRRVNLLLYFNDEWPAAYGGALELWSTDMSRRVVTIEPVGNRAVIFDTESDSFHGHPDPMQCPPGESRKSLALYYFTVESDPMVRSTEYRARPGEGLRGILIYIDKQALRLYDRAKRRLGISDARMDKFLRRFRSKRRSGTD
jgi:hypothetical protein